MLVSYIVLIAIVFIKKGLIKTRNKVPSANVWKLLNLVYITRDISMHYIWSVATFYKYICANKVTVLCSLMSKFCDDDFWFSSKGMGS